ncbi:hypothetical protein SI65_05052 [Aspergillus cristatus]|uniref:Uncharacterized protein n=1 Tax=Aspergillus cristatus TaxID=573508 RepID=A0A1E3BI55_ASPCR|nr:hypothetical protein SI65_05052 [Aspergillus cristatus]
MFRSISRFSLHNIRSAPTSRAFHRITTDFIKHDTTGKLVTEKVGVIVGDQDESYILIDPEIGLAFRAAAASSATVLQDRCKLQFFHNSQHFGFGQTSAQGAYVTGASSLLDPLSYPRLYVPNQMPRQTESNASPATLMLYGEMHEIVLNETFDAKFSEHGEASALT